MLFSGVLALFLLLVLADLGSQILRGQPVLSGLASSAWATMDSICFKDCLSLPKLPPPRWYRYAVPSGQQPDIPEGHPPEASTAVGRSQTQ